jgi:hypothetical protein
MHKNIHIYTHIRIGDSSGIEFDYAGGSYDVGMGTYIHTDTHTHTHTHTYR